MQQYNHTNYGEILKNKPIRSPKHLKYVRSKPCMIKNDEGLNCNMEVVAHHTTFLKGKRGISQKVGDNYTIPICFSHHHNLHYIGEKLFWKMHDYELDQVLNYANTLWSESNE